MAGHDRGTLTVAERTELERLRAEARERREADELKQRLLGDVVHELRSPLTVSQAAIANLADGLAGPLTAMQKEFIAMTQRNLDRLGRLVLNALDYSRLDSGGESLEVRRLDARRLISEIAADWKPSLARHLAVVVDLKQTLPWVRADAEHFASVLGSLLDIASRRADRELRVAAREEGGMLRITVEDDGSAATEDKGAVLGVAICHEIARRSGGRVWLDRTGIAAARLHFELPCWKPIP